MNRSPQMKRWPQVSTLPAMVLVSLTGPAHHSPLPAVGSMAAASATAPSALIAPAPWVSVS